MRLSNTPKRRITSVWLRRNDGMDWEIYYCSTCRAPLLQHRNDVVVEIPGEAPMRLPVLIQCHNRACSRLYQFETIIEETWYHEGRVTI